ncbi:MAG TPA: DUF502 domain-containing protein [Planctomycetota bacterium]|nr:DUF502 domain-containing protein [Planctomycetota bacterium]
MSWNADPSPHNHPGAVGAPAAAGGPPNFWAGLRTTLLAGVLVFLPVAITVWVLNLLDSPFRSTFSALSDWFKDKQHPDVASVFGWLAFPGVGLVLGFILILLLGILARNYLGHYFIQWMDDVAKRIPLIRTIYSGTKQLSDTVFTSAGKESFRRAVLVRFPNEHSYAIGFVTGETKGAAQAVTVETVVNVFVPTTPNPTSGFLLMIPAERMIPLNMSVENALKVVISGGIFTPAAEGAVAPAAAPAPGAPPGQSPSGLRD